MNFIAIFFFGVLVFSSAWGAQPTKIHSELLRRFDQGSVALPIMVKLKGSADLSAAEKITDREERSRWMYQELRTVALHSQRNILIDLKAKGLRVRPYYVLNAVAVWGVNRETLLEISNRNDVEKIFGNLPIQNIKPKPFDLETFLRDDQEPFGPGENVVRIGAPTVWNGKGKSTRGEGIVVAGQDTGYAWEHPALKEKYRGWVKGQVSHDYHWHDAIHSPMAEGKNPCGYDSAEPCDDNAHGTHTMGTIVGDDEKGNQIGVAPGAQWIGCRNMDQGVGSPATYIECFEFFFAPYPRGGNAFTDGDPSKAPHVINNSWGCPPSEGCEGPEILEVVKVLQKAGILVVVSAGNDGPDCETIKDPPASYAQTFRVGAFDHRNDSAASFSSRGPSKFDGSVGPEVSAPGVSIRSSVPTGGYEGALWSGTSMAGPHAVGAVALLWSGFPRLKGQLEETRSVLQQAAEAKGSTQTCGFTPGDQIPNNTFGHGLLNISRAFDLMQTWYPKE